MQYEKGDGIPEIIILATFRQRNTYQMRQIGLDENVSGSRHVHP
jgi:hypothetical protein